MCGKEFCNAYAELNDPLEQWARFEEQVRQKDQGDEETQVSVRLLLLRWNMGFHQMAVGVGIDREGENEAERSMPGVYSDPSNFSSVSSHRPYQGSRHKPPSAT
jgi:hypothetical protein